MGSTDYGENMKSENQVRVPEGKLGTVEVKRFSVSVEEAKFSAIRGMTHDGRCTPAGTYTGLYINGQLVMSDTPDEIRDHLYAMHKATGNVLVNGLGLGMVVQGMARKDVVTHLTVIEINEDVIKLVWPYYKKRFGKKVECICADAFAWKPPKGVRYDYVWHDIWADICSDNLAEMAKLHRKYGRRAAMQDSWARALCQRQRARGY
jgi:hypothetical protein